MKIKKFEEILNEEILNNDEHHLNLIIQYLFKIQDNFTKLGNNPILLKSLKNDLLGIVKRYNLH
mgnify:CR=1 FL=1